jgi:hypothetical protein
MVGGVDVMAMFDEADGPTSAVTLTLAGDGTGSVAADGVTCEKASASPAGPCEAVYLSGSLVTLQASPGAGSGFAGYSAGTNQAGACGAAAQCSFTLTADASVTAQLDATAPPILSLTPGTLTFAAVKSGSGAVVARTSSQALALRQTGAGTVTWSAVPAHPWIVVNPSAGTGPAVLTVSVTPTDSLVPAVGAFSTTISILATGAASNPSAEIRLNVLLDGTSTAPIGSFDTPLDDAAGLTGSIAVTGWTLDDVEVTRVRIFREPVAGEGSHLVFIGNATFVEGARPDVEVGYPSLPRNRRGGWGYLLLTNFLPNEGNGTFELYAYADDADGHSRLLGTKTITCDNAHATVPFGAIDTPAQGETIAGPVYANFGWVLAKGTVRAHPPFGTVTVFVNGVPAGVPAGWVSRADLTALFPAAAYAGVGNALAVWTLDTTTLADGVTRLRGSSQRTTERATAWAAGSSRLRTAPPALARRPWKRPFTNAPR